ncbi:MAG: amidohydrolase [Oscillospiraceae bacterium]|nr:amidohydrolase [Oscillospiraceae bacterium]
MKNSGAIINAIIVTVDAQRRVLTDAGILWHDGIITAIGTSAEVSKAAAEAGVSCKDAKGAIVFPGLINTHNHIFQHLLKGLGTDMNLEDWWPTVIGPAGTKLREQHLRAAVMGASLEALRTGTTTIVDYMQVHPVKGLSAVELETAEKSGIRLMYGRGFRDGGKSNVFSQKGLSENLQSVFDEVAELNRTYSTADHMRRVYLAPASPPALSLEGLTATAQFARSAKIPVTMHVFETASDDRICLSRDGMPTIDYLETAGMLHPDFLAVHCVQVNEDIIARFKKNDVKVSHNPLSNMYLASGVAPVPAYRKAGITVSLTTDGAASNNSNNMLEVLKGTALLHKVFSGDPQAVSAPEVLEMATMGGARAIGLEKELGSLEVGKRADLFLFDPLKSPTCCPMFDPVSTLVYSSDSRGVTMTVVNGRVLLQDDRFTHVDEEEVLREEQRQARDLAAQTGFSGV